MKSVEIIKEIKKQLGRVPTYDEVNELCNKPSIIIGKKKEKKAQKISDYFKKYESRQNQSWYIQLRNVLLEKPNRTCMIYRGTKITGQQFVENVERLVCELTKKGIKERDIIAVCMENTPEYVYLKCALNYIGAICNSFVPNYPPNKIQEILNSSSNKALFLTDSYYELCKDYIKCFENVYVNSKADSLSRDSKPPIEYNDKLKSRLEKYYSYTSSIWRIREKHDNIIGIKEVIQTSKIEKSIIDELDKKQIKSDDVCSITYTSGSTSDNPKGMYHTNSSVIISAIRHKKDVSGTASMEGMSSLFNIHSDSNTGNITQCLDILFQGGIVLPEPEYSKENFLDILYINKPNIAASTTSFFVEAAKTAKNYDLNNELENMPWLFVPVAVGEGLTNKEESFLNSFLHYVKAAKGFKVGGMTMPIPTVMSIGGGDCERGGIFFTILRKIKEIRNKVTGKGELGLESYPDVKIAVLNPITLEEVDYCQNGIIVTSETKGTLKGYVGRDSQIRTTIIDKYGRKWCKMNVEGSINKDGSIKIIGRYSPTIKFQDGIECSVNELNEYVSKIKRIFSVSSNVVSIGNNSYIIINYIPCKEAEDRKYGSRIFTKDLDETIKEEIKEKLSEIYGQGILNFILIRRLNTFPLTGSGKRNMKEVASWGTFNTEPLSKKEKELKKDF